mmetsp:Transcript_19337/g.39235  ORF Transcript_19337/g.39235 Transcript_19337/m.39235 type:complete len:204 (+) Transcript_19337:922-1533(+)
MPHINIQIRIIVRSNLTGIILVWRRGHVGLEFFQELIGIVIILFPLILLADITHQQARNTDIDSIHPLAQRLMVVHTFLGRVSNIVSVVVPTRLQIFLGCFGCCCCRLLSLGSGTFSSFVVNCFIMKNINGSMVTHSLNHGFGVRGFGIHHFRNLLSVILLEFGGRVKPVPWNRQSVSYQHAIETAGNALFVDDDCRRCHGNW